MFGEVVHHQHEEEGHEEDGQYGGTHHAADDAGADGDTAAGTGARTGGQRQHAEDKGQRGHEDGAQAQTRRFHHRLGEPLALLIELLGELDDQDGVLGREADCGQQPHLEVDVILQAAQHGRQHGAQDPQRYYQHDGEGDAPALIQRRQRQEHHQQGDGIQGRSLGACLPLLEGEAGPLYADAIRQGLDDLLDGGHGLTGTLAWGCLTHYFHGRYAVIALQTR